MWLSTDRYKNTAEYLLQKGRCLNVAPDFSAKAEECLSRAVKLEPGLVEGWNTLGEQYWKKGDLMGAKNCFTGALQQVQCGWKVKYMKSDHDHCFTLELHARFTNLRLFFLHFFCLGRVRTKCPYATCPWYWDSCLWWTKPHLVSRCWRVWNWHDKLFNWMLLMGRPGVSADPDP